MYRSYHGSTAAAITATGDPRRWANEPTAIGVVHFWGPYPYRSAFHAESEAQECERALAHLRDTIVFEGPGTIAAILLETVVGTNGILVPPPGYLAGRTGAVRRVRHRLHRRRGDGRVRPLRRVVRGRPLGRDAGPDHVREGRQLRLPAARRRHHLRRHRRDVPGAGVPGRADLLGSPARLRLGRRLDPDFQGGGDRRACPGIGEDVIGPGLADLAARHPSVGEVRGLGVFWALELVQDRSTPRAAGALQRGRSGGGTHERTGRRLQAARVVAVHPFQPGPRGAAVHGDRRRSRPRGWPFSTRRWRWPTGSTRADSADTAASQSKESVARR